jgi:hypothetical protein
MFEPVKMAFARHLVVLPLSNILPMKRVPDSIKQTLRYKRIISSIGKPPPDLQAVTKIWR